MFRKYFKIEGTWRPNEILWWLEKYPELRNETYVLQEKIHGANVSWVFEPDGTMSIAKRGSIIKDENFYNHKLMYELYGDVIILLRDYAYDNNCSMNIYGEWFGEGIQKGVNYGPGKQLRFFDVIVNDVLLTPFEVDDLFSLLNIEDMMVPVLGQVDTLRKALDFPIEKVVTDIYPEGKSTIEGIVIKPYYNTFFEFNDPDGPSTKLGSTFYLKKKSDEFKEKQSKKRKPGVNQPPHVERIKNNFSDYITENRLSNVFSKHGEIQSDKDIGKYIKLMLEDAKEEFTKDYSIDIMDCSDKELKYVYNASKEIVIMLKERIICYEI